VRRALLLFLACLALAVARNQFTAWTRPSGFEISSHVLRAPKTTVMGSGSIPGGPGGFGGGEANISLAETVVGVGLGADEKLFDGAVGAADLDGLVDAGLGEDCRW